MRICDIVLVEERVSPALLSDTSGYGATPNLPSANTVKNQKVQRRVINQPQSATMVYPAQIGQTLLARRKVHENTLTELFDQHARVRQLDQHRYMFSVEGKQFYMTFGEVDGPNAIEVVLSRGQPGLMNTPFDLFNDLRQHAVMVYSTAIAIILKYMRVYHPHVVFIPGFSQDQQHAYLKMASYMIKKQSPDYDMTAQPNGTIAFVMKRLHEEDDSMELSRDEVNRIEHDKMSKPNKAIRNAKPIAMPGNTSTYPAF